MPTQASTSNKARAAGADKASAGAAPPAAATKAFGIAINMADKSAAAKGEKPPMTRAKKQMYWAGGMVVVAAGILYLQYRPTPDVDRDAEAHPQVKEVVAAEKKADTNQLADLAKSQDEVVASRAIASLATVGGPDMVRDYMADRRPQVRYAAVTGLGASGSPAALPALQKFSADPDQAVRVATVRSIANIDDFKIFDHLIPMLNDADASVRRAAKQGIESRIGLVFPDYDPEGPGDARGKAIGHIRMQISKMKQRFDETLAIDKARRARARK